MSGLSQAELARRLDVWPYTVNRWVKGHREVPTFVEAYLGAIKDRAIRVRSRAAIQRRTIYDDGDNSADVALLTLDDFEIEAPAERKHILEILTCVAGGPPSSPDIDVLVAATDCLHVLDASNPDPDHWEFLRQEPLPVWLGFCLGIGLHIPFLLSLHSLLISFYLSVIVISISMNIQRMRKLSTKT